MRSSFVVRLFKAEDVLSVSPAGEALMDWDQLCPLAANALDSSKPQQP